MYILKRDGKLIDYLRIHNGDYSNPIFKGSKYYMVLWDRGYFVSGFSAIRLMWSFGR